MQGKLSTGVGILASRCILVIGVFVVALLAVSGSVSALDQLAWSVSSTGVVTAQTLPSTNYGAVGYVYMTPTVPTSVINSTLPCNGGGSGSSYSYPYSSLSVVGSNVFSFGIGNAAGMGEPACNAPGDYYYVLWSATTPYNAVAYYELYYDGTHTFPVAPVTNTQTRIDTVVPANGSNAATSTSFMIGATGYVNVNDLSSSTAVQIKYFWNASTQLAVASPASLITTITIPVSASGAFSLSTTTSIVQAGQYTMTTSLISNNPNQSWWSALLGNIWATYTGNSNGSTLSLVSTSTIFYAAGANQFDNFVASTTASISSYLASSTVSLASCTSFSGFNLGDCLNLLFVPQQAPITQALQNFRDGFLSYAPWGYVTLTMSDILGAGTSTLPSLNITLPNGYPGGGTSADLTPWTLLLSSGSMLSTATDPNTGKTLYAIVYPGWSNFVYLLFAVVIFGELVGIGGKWISSATLE